jgi:hypothetical protein
VALARAGGGGGGCGCEAGFGLVVMFSCYCWWYLWWQFNCRCGLWLLLCLRIGGRVQMHRLQWQGLLKVIPLWHVLVRAFKMRIV